MKEAFKISVSLGKRRPKASKIKYLINRGWYTFGSSNNWLNNEVMDDISLDSSGLSLDEAYCYQKSNLSKIK